MDQSDTSNLVTGVSGCGRLSICLLLQANFVGTVIHMFASGSGVWLHKEFLLFYSDCVQDKGDAMCMVHADAWRARPKIENAVAEVRSLAAVAIAAGGGC